MNNKIGIIIQREFKERVQKKSFIITTLLTPLLMVGLMVAPMLIMTYSESEQKNIIVVDDSGIVAPQLQDNDEITFKPIPLPIDSARKIFRDNYFAILHIGNDILTSPNNVRLYTNESSSITIESNIATQIEMVLQGEKLKRHNIENLPQILADIKIDVSLQSFKNDGDEEDKSSSTIVATVIAYILSFMLYMFLLIYGVMVMQSVIEEKNNRVLEVMVSSVRPFDMMLGKILGVASVAVLQIVIWIALIACVGYLIIPHIMPAELSQALALLEQGLPVADTANAPDSGLLQAILALTDTGYLVTICVSLLLLMVGGFLLYAAMFAAIGSAVDNAQDAQQLQLPITLPIILALLIMLSVINDPVSDIAFWFSMIPLTSPIVMMARVPYDIPTWEIVVSLVLLYATFIAVVWLASKIYRVGILMHGKKPGIKELWRWFRYK
ncbi:MAG: ABC transporter permease [Bacteroidaceae bacterium]|nr:ABC transporter permease [Bacteroidaceae bacterium]MBQ3623708.1 ABC transporter permease [Bacteroidaceae bacterium]